MKDTKTLRIVLDLVLIIVGIVFLGIGIKDAYNSYKENNVGDNVLFKRHYLSAKSDNIYKFTTIEELNEVINSASGVILIGSPSDVWTIALVNPLDDIVGEHLNEILYLEISDGEDYTSIENSIGKLTNPTIVIVDEGKVLKVLKREDIIDETFEGTPFDYFTEHTSNLEENLKEITELTR